MAGARDDMWQPVGVPISVVGRVTLPRGDASAGDLRTSVNRRISVQEAASGVTGTLPAKQEFTLEHVFNPELTNADLFDRSISPLVKALVEGVSVTVLFTGTSISGKTESARSSLPLSIHTMFQLLDQKEQGIERQRGRGKRHGSGFVYGVTVSAVEVYDESIKDLLDPRRRNLQVKDDASHGVVVQGASVRGPFTEPESAAEAIEESLENRTTMLSEFGPASKYTATVWVLEIHQKHPGSSSHHMSTLACHLTIVELPGTEKLCESVSTLRMREGPTLNKGLLTLVGAVDQINKAQAEDKGAASSSYAAAYGDSTLTRLIQEVFGGNTIGLCVASMAMGDSAGSVATLKFATALQSLRTFPIVNDDRAIGLIRSFRETIAHLRYELEAGRAVPVSQGEEQDYAVRISELEGQLVQDGLERMRLKDDNEKVFSKLAEFRSKYNHLVESKAAIQSALIKSEEEKLRVSKALVDLRIENNQLVDRGEGEKHELVNKLLNAENEILQLEMKEENRNRTHSTLEEDLAVHKHKYVQITQEFVTLQETLSKVESQYKQELAKNEELGVELLNLVNHKNTLHTEKELLQREHVKLHDNAVATEERVRYVVKEKEDLQEKLAQVRSEYEQLQSAKLKLEVEVERQTLDFENRRFDMDKSTHELLRQKESQVSAMTKSTEAAHHKADLQKQTLTTRVKGFEVLLQKSTRKINDLETKLKEKEELARTLAVDNATLADKLQHATETFRSKVLELLGQNEASPKQQPSNKGTQEENKTGRRSSVSSTTTDAISTSATTGQVTVEHLRNELVQTYATREQELLDQLTGGQQRLQGLLTQNRVLFEKYSRAKVHLERLAPLVDKLEAEAHGESSRVEDNNRTSVTILPDIQLANDSGKESFSLQRRLEDKNVNYWTSESLEKEDSDLRTQLEEQERNLQRQIQDLKNKINAAHSELTAIKERAYVSAEHSQRVINEWQTKYNDAMAELQLIERQKLNLQEENEALARRGSGGGSGDDAMTRTQDSRASKELEQLQRTLLSKLEELKDMRPSTGGVADGSGYTDQGSVRGERESLSSATGGGGGNAQQLAEENATLKRELAALRAEKRATRRETLKTQLRSPSGSMAVVQEEGGQAPQGGGKLGELLTRVTVAEEELSGYKTYMQSVLAKHQKQVSKLKEEVKLWKKKAKG